MREEPGRKSRRVVGDQEGRRGAEERRRRGRSVITGASTKLLCIGPQETDTGWSIQHSWAHRPDIMQAYDVHTHAGSS